MVNKGTIAAVVIIGLISIGVVAYFAPQWLGTGIGGEMSVQFYKDGKAVTTPNTMSFIGEGVSTDELRVTLGWTITGSDIRALEEGIHVSGFVKLYVQKLQIQTNQVYWAEIGSYSFSEGRTLVDSRVASFDLLSISELDPDIQTSWTLKLEGQISVLAEFEDGSSQSATWPADGTPKEGTIALSWETQAGAADDLILEGYWSY